MIELVINDVKKTFNEWNSLKCCLSELNDKNTKKGIIIKLILDNKDTMLLGLGTENEGFIQYTDNAGNCYATINKRDATSIQIFDFGGYYTEIEEKHMISFDEILSILENCFYDNLKFDKENWVEI